MKGLKLLKHLYNQEGNDMSWKLFLQIVLLMIIGGLILCALKCGMMHKYGFGCKMHKMGSEQAQGAKSAACPYMK